VRPARGSAFVLVEVDPVGSQEEGIGPATANPMASTCSAVLWMRDWATVICWPVQVRRRAPQQAVRDPDEGGFDACMSSVRPGLD